VFKVIFGVSISLGTITVFSVLLEVCVLVSLTIDSFFSGIETGTGVMPLLIK